MSRSLAAAVAAFTSALSLVALAPADASACTTFRIRSKDGAILIGRSMELGMPLDSAVMIVPRGFGLAATRPDQKPGTTWVSKYGFAGMNTLGVDISTDGMNEAGLSVGALYIPGFVKYQPFPSKPGVTAISNLELANWLLSSFATVDEVRAALPKVVVYDLTIPPAGPQPLHWAVADARGGAIVVEYVGGELRVHDNPIGTLTNSPDFDWHLTNLRQYVNLRNVNADPLRLGSVEIAPLGQGSGLLGIPGDYTPPSRFVRATALAWSVVPPATASEGVQRRLPRPERGRHPHRRGGATDPGQERRGAHAGLRADPVGYRPRPREPAPLLPHLREPGHPGGRPREARPRRQGRSATSRCPPRCRRRT